MIKRTLAIAAVLSIAGTPALAGHCPRDVKAIDAALAANPSLAAPLMSQVKQLRDQGAEQHGSGNHAASLQSLHEAMKILGIKH